MDEVNVKVKADTSKLIAALKAAKEAGDKLSGTIKLDIVTNVNDVNSALKDLATNAKSISRINPKINISSNSTEQIERLNKVLSKAKELSNVKPKVNITSNVSEQAKALSKLATVFSNVSGTKNVKINVSGNMDKALETMQGIASLVTKLNVRKVNISGTVKMNGISKTLTDLDKIVTRVAEVKEIPNAKLSIGITGAAEVRKEIGRVIAGLVRLNSMKNVTVNVKTRQSGGNVGSVTNNSSSGGSSSGSTGSRVPRGSMDFSVGGIVQNIGRATKGTGSFLEVLGKMANSAAGASGALGILGGTFGVVTLGLSALLAVGTAVTSVFQTLGPVFEAIAEPGYKFAKDIEMARISIAGTITSMGQIGGQDIPYAKSLQVADDIVNKLQIDAIKTAASTQELVRTFQGLAAPGLGAGMDLGEIQKFTVTGVNTAKAMNLGPEQFIQELRDLTQGGIQAGSSTIATSLGLTDADIQKAQASAEGLFKFLMDRMKGYTEAMAMFPDTFQGMEDKVKEFGTMASAELTKAFSPEIGALLQSIAEYFGHIDDEQNKFVVNPEIIDMINWLKDAYLWLVEGYDAVTNFFSAMGKNESIIILIGILKDLWGMFTDVLDIIGELIVFMGQVFRMASNSAPFLIFMDAVKMLGDILKWCTGQIENFLNKLNYFYKRNNDAQLGSNGNYNENGTLQGGAAEKIIEARRKKAELDAQKEAAKSAGIGFDPNDIKSKYPNDKAAKAAEKAQKEAIKQSQRALKDGLKLLKNFLDELTNQYKDDLEALDVKLANNDIGYVEYATIKAEKDKAYKEKEMSITQQQIDLAKNTLYSDPDQKEAKIDELQKQYDQQARELSKINDGIEGMSDAVGIFSKKIKQATDSIALLGSTGTGVPSGTPATKEEDAIRQAAMSTGVDYSLVKAIAMAESNMSQTGSDGNTLGSSAGAQGMMQVMPETFSGIMPQGNIDNVYDNAMAGAKYLKQLLDTFSGDVTKAVAAYNAGPQAVKNAGGVPNYSETQAYVPKVLNYMQQYERELASQAKATPQNGVAQVEITNFAELPQQSGMEDTGLANTNETLKRVTTAFADTVLKNLGQSATVSSGWRSPENNAASGGAKNSYHLTGNAIDLVLDNVDEEMANAITEKAKSLGFGEALFHDVGSGAHLHLANFQGNYEDFMAKIGTSIGGLSTQMGAAKNKIDQTGRDKLKEIMKRIMDVHKAYRGLFGDISSVQIAENVDKWDDIIAKLMADGQVEFAKEAEVLKQIATRGLLHEQNTADLNRAIEDLQASGELMAAKVTNGAVSAEDAVQAYTDHYTSKNFGDMLTKMEAYRDKLQQDGMLDEFWKVDKQIKDIKNGIVANLQKFVDNIGDKYTHNNDMIEANRKLTDRQKASAKQQSDSNKYLEQNLANDKLMAYYRQQWLQAKSQREMDTIVNEKMIPLQRIIETNKELAKIPTLMDDIHSSSKQAFEDGLLTFLTDGINEAESLGEAFNNMIISILKSIQKVFAQKLTDQIMGALFPAEVVNPNSAAKAVDNSLNLNSPAKDKIALPIDTSFDTGTVQLTDTASVVTSSMGELNNSLQSVLTNLLNGVNQIIDSVQMANYSLPSAGTTSTGASDNSKYSFTVPKLYARGGRVSGPGTGTSDSIPSMLSHGEYVLTADTVRRVGTDYLDMMNNGRLFDMPVTIPKFATGGVVGKTGAKSTAKAMTGFAKDMGTNVSNTAHLNMAIVKDEQEAIEKFFTSRRGQKVMVNFNNTNSKLMSRTLNLK